MCLEKGENSLRGRARRALIGSAGYGWRRVEPRRYFGGDWDVCIGRYYVTRDGRVIGGSEVGMIPVENDNVLAKGRLMPGRMFLIDFAQVRMVAPVLCMHRSFWLCSDVCRESMSRSAIRLMLCILRCRAG